MSNEQLGWLAANARQTWFEADEIIFTDGDVASRFFLIVNGEVALELPGDGRMERLQTFGPGDPLGWSWLFSSHVSLVRARAVEPSEVLFFYGTHLREQCMKDPEFGCELFRRVAELAMQRLHATRQLLRERRGPGAMVG